MKITDTLACITYIETQIRGSKVHKRVNMLNLSNTPFAVPEKLEWEVNCCDNGLVLSTEFKFGMKENGYPCKVHIYAPVFGTSDTVNGSWHLRVNHDDFDSASGRLPESFTPKPSQPKAA